MPSIGAGMQQASSDAGRKGRATILLSGGIDSTACVDFYDSQGFASAALFLNYGQRAARQELAAAKRVAKLYGIPLSVVRIAGAGTWGRGYVPARNAVLVATALMGMANLPSVLALGIHAGTNYVDCSPRFVRAMQRLADLYTDGRIQIGAPFLRWTKAELYRHCRTRRLQVHLTYSCEYGGPTPCRTCTSCRDRDRYDAS